MTGSSKKEDILRKVQSLITLADHPNTPMHEADTARNMAEALMFKYRIDQLDLSAADKTQAAINVVWRTVDLCDRDSEYRHQYASLAFAVIAHMDIRGVCTTDKRGESYADDVYVVQMVGYEADVMFAEMLITAARLAFGKALEPKLDRTLSDQVNAYLMRSAGMEGHRIAMAIYGSDDMKLRPKVRAMFKAEAILRGEDPTALLGKGSNMKLYRESFAQGFTTTFSNRLYRMRESRGMVSHGLVLANRKEAIDEAFYERFPQYRPQPASTPQIGNGHGSCPKCAKAASGYCRDHQWMKPRKGRTRYANSTALDRGRNAARSVDLGITGRELS